MKYLTQTEILSWNKRNFKIIDNPYYVNNSINLNYKVDYYGNNVVIAHFLDSFGSLEHQGSLKKRMGELMTGVPLNPTIVNTINVEYIFCYSVVENHNEDFFNLLDKLLKSKFSTHYYYNEKDIKTINFNKAVLDSTIEESYTLCNRKFKRYQCFFKGDLFSIMAYVSYLEDAINCFNLLYGYDEDGKEVNIVKYPIGSIVTLINENSKDYLVIDYIYSKYIDDFFISYTVAEILYTNKPVIKYGEVIDFKEDDICISRNGRIEQILN